MYKGCLYLLVLMFAVSCSSKFTLQKRRYSKGFYFSSQHSNKENESKYTTNTRRKNSNQLEKHNIETVEQLDKLKTEHATDEGLIIAKPINQNKSKIGITYKISIPSEAIKLQSKNILTHRLTYKHKKAKALDPLSLLLFILFLIYFIYAFKKVFEDGIVIGLLRIAGTFMVLIGFTALTLPLASTLEWITVIMTILLGAFILFMTRPN